MKPFSYNIVEFDHSCHIILEARIGHKSISNRNVDIVRLDMSPSLNLPHSFLCEFYVILLFCL